MPIALKPASFHTHRSGSLKGHHAAKWVTTAFAITISLGAFAQNAPEPLKNFKKYPNGEWLQESRRTDAAGSGAPPVTNKGCKSPADPKDILTASKVNNAFASFCNTVKITDTERVYEYEQTCKINGTDSQVMRITGRAVDDKTMTVDTRLTVKGMPDTVTHTKLTYNGATCAAPARAKASAADCAQFAAMQAESSSGEDSCAGMQAEDRKLCETQVAAGRKAFAAVAERCK